jgi:hypothetical protein
MDHLTSKLGAAGLVDMVITSTASAQVTIHTEKAAHITSKLGAAGLDTGSGVVAEVKDTTPASTSQAKAAASTTSSKSDFFHHTGPGEWAVITVVIALVLISAAAGLFFALKRRRRRYGAVAGKQKAVMVEKDVFNAEIHEAESESLQQQEAGLRERHFESGYDNADSHYDGSDYEVKPTHGDKRAQYGD